MWAERVFLLLIAHYSPLTTHYRSGLGNAALSVYWDSVHGERAHPRPILTYNPEYLNITRPYRNEVCRPTSLAHTTRLHIHLHALWFGRLASLTTCEVLPHVRAVTCLTNSGAADSLVPLPGLPAQLQTHSPPEYPADRTSSRRSSSCPQPSRCAHLLCWGMGA